MRLLFRSLLPAAMFALALCAPVTAQHVIADADTTTTPSEAHQFDFLVGEWELEIHPKVSGLAAMIHGAPKLLGSWKAWRSFDGRGLEDELRILDPSGNPLWLIHSLRVFDRAAGRWTVLGLDGYRARSSNSTARWQDSEMRLEGNGTDAEGKGYVFRTRFFDIAADTFHMRQDRSYDNGQTWEEGTLSFDAKRVAATASH